MRLFARWRFGMSPYSAGFTGEFPFGAPIQPCCRSCGRQPCVRRPRWREGVRKMSGSKAGPRCMPGSLQRFSCLQAPVRFREDDRELRGISFMALPGRARESVGPPKQDRATTGESPGPVPQARRAFAGSSGLTRHFRSWPCHAPATSTSLFSLWRGGKQRNCGVAVSER
jgi:hypothetical protein